MRDEPPLLTAGHGMSPPNPTIGRNVGKGWIGMIGGAHGAIPSPASSGGHEDDHSQRLYVPLSTIREFLADTSIGLTIGYQLMRLWR